ncbi:scaffoldin [Anaeromyces robustus]|uniref:Scaffoldin n=1 Tax=Anaeromyces robustus TaxID=1754192 RepID=A0A1Y1VDB9_9FUNG|nr:scaffoldin [Anaeromyces robustus]|eukprot:ORX52658.1 scaffoldin [Anaeromyces robustus]
MRTINYLKLFAVFGFSLFNNVNAAIPKCNQTETKDASGNTTYKVTTTDVNSKYCLYNDMLYTYDSPTKPLEKLDLDNFEPGLNFIKDTSFEKIDDSKSNANLFKLNVDGNKKTVREEEITKGNYVNADSEVIYCTSGSSETKSCQLVDTSSLASPSFFIQESVSGKGLIMYSENGIEQYTEIKDGYYLNGNFNMLEGSKQLLKCSQKTCTEVVANDGDVYDNILEEDEVIQCLLDATANVVKCKTTKPESPSFFINKSVLDLSEKPLISCTNSVCKSEAPSDPYLYFENPLNYTKIIYCSSTKSKCSYLEGMEEGDAFVSNYEDLNGIVLCSIDQSDSTLKCQHTTGSPNGYYLNSGGDNGTNQVINCADNNCVTKSVNPGYYINANPSEDKELIECKLDQCSFIKKDDAACPTTFTVGACYKDSTLVFNKLENEELVSTKDDLYVYATLRKFPSITTETSTLFRITPYSVERFIDSGVVVITSSNTLATDISENSSDILLFECSTNTKLCVSVSSCTNNTYMYDTANHKALYCKNGKLQIKSENGYYVDGSSVVNSKTPYLISCKDDVCTHILPTVSSYFVNAGEDSSTNALIYCNNNSCNTVSASNGYYVANQQSGIINCSSSSSCDYKDVSGIGNNANFVNNGNNKTTYALIYCNKKSCVPKKAKNGYYFPDNASSLIYCESSNNCSVIIPTVNYYYYADSSDNKNYIINCNKVSTSIVCSKELADTGSYLTNQSNVLITCSKNGSCKQVVAKPGYYQSAVKITINSSRDVSDASAESELVSGISGRDSTTTYSIIECTQTTCEYLTAEELSTIPVCEYNGDKCYITLSYALSKSAVNSIAAGNLCTNADRSVFYFATDTIVVAPSVIAGQTSTYVYTTTTTNCIIVSNKYSNLYYTVGSDIYHLDDGVISHFYDNGYYFIDIEKNTLVNSNSIDNYNSENIKLYKCNGIACSIIDEPEVATYYADVNKRIIKYNVNNDAYQFAYEKDIVCIFANNKCTPNADLNAREFCITYKGELVLAASDIKNRETGDCYKASSINNYIYGYNQYLYKMDVNSASVIENNGYYLISLSTNNTISAKDYKNRLINANLIKIYGCHSSTCKVYEPEDGVYYYDSKAKTMLKNTDGIWYTPKTSGYALVSVNPEEKYIYKFKSELDDITLLSKAATGYYYTIDNEMYECNENDNVCEQITESDYYFTNTGEIYYCVYDSENLEKTECTKQSCYVGQHYFIKDGYYKCEAGSYFTAVKSKNCKYDENVIINFPTILKEEFPTNIKQAIENVEKNNNSTAVAARTNKKYLSVIPAIFTNCTYNVEETEASYDLVCINNYVAVNEEDDTIEICSIENLGYVECVDDETNQEKCNPSSAYARITFNFFTVALSVIAAFYFIF